MQALLKEERTASFDRLLAAGIAAAFAAFSAHAAT